MICHVLSVILGGNVVAAGSELYRCTHFQFVITLLQKIQHMEGDYIQLQEFFYQDLLSLTTNQKHCYRFFRLIRISPLKKVEETNSTHRKFGRSVYFCSFGTSFSCIFFVSKNLSSRPPFPQNRCCLDHVLPRGEFVDPWKSVCESNGC